MKLRRLKRPASWRAYIRAGGVVAAVMALAGGVTYAALQSQQVKLAGNTIQTATANLQISSDGVNYGATEPGFVFGAIIPGGQASPNDGYPVFLKNAGGTPLALKLAVSSTPSNADGADLAKVHVLLVPTAGGSVQNFTLQSLVSAAATGGQPILSPAQLLPGATAGYKLQVSMEGDAMTGPGAVLNNIDLSFSGLASGQ